MNATTTVKKKAPAKKTAAAPKETIRSMAERLFKGGLTNDQVLEAVQKKFPDAKTSPNSIRWYRNKAREKTTKVPGSRDAARKQDKAAAKEKAPAKKASAKKDMFQ